MVFKKYAKKLNGSLNVDRMGVPDKEKDRFRNWLLAIRSSAVKLLGWPAQEVRRNLARLRPKRSRSATRARVK